MMLRIKINRILISIQTIIRACLNLDNLLIIISIRLTMLNIRNIMMNNKIILNSE